MNNIFKFSALPVIVATTMASHQAAGTFDNDSGGFGGGTPDSNALDYWGPIINNNAVIIGVLICIVIYGYTTDSSDIIMEWLFDIFVSFSIFTFILFGYAVYEIDLK